MKMNCMLFLSDKQNERHANTVRPCYTFAAYCQLIMTDPVLSIVLPTYKERENLTVFIPQIEQEFVATPIEIIIVDDNSADGTVELVAELNAQYSNVRIIVRPALLGIGSAIRRGYDEAHGEFILSSDADLSFSVADMRRLFEKIQEGFDLVTGYRHNGGGYERKTLSVKIKYLFSKFGNQVVQKLSRLRTRDFSANFRIIRRDAWHKIETRENTNALLAEIIFKSFRKVCRTPEIPVTFSERRFGESKLNLWKEAPKFLFKFVKFLFV